MYTVTNIQYIDTNILADFHFEAVEISTLWKDRERLYSIVI